MTDMVRVKLPTGEVTVSAEFAAVHDLTVLDGVPAADARGVALDAKPLRSVEEAADAADTRTPAQKAADTRARKKAAADAEAAAEQEREDARVSAQEMADAANQAAQETSSPTGDADSTEETR